MVGFQTVTVVNLRKRVHKLVLEYNDILKQTRQNKKNVDTKESFLIKLESLFDIATPGLEQIISADRIRKFLEDQRGDRKWNIGAIDREFSERIKDQADRKQKARARPAQSETSLSKASRQLMIQVFNDKDKYCSK